MRRCIEIAGGSLGKTAPNPLVGAVIVHDGDIIGEGFHEVFGGPHAEVNAINSVEKKLLLTQATLFVNLEPCAHFGKTPPCANLIVANKIPKVVIGSSDPFPEVSGKGIEILRSAGIEVVCGILEKECIELNKRFYTFYTKHRPYVILKWAQTNDGFMAGIEQKRGESLKITNQNTNKLVHQWRSEEQGILVGKGTILADDPLLNVRLIDGNQPVPFIMANEHDIPGDYKIHSFHPIFVRHFDQIKEHCLKHKIQSILVEGGPEVLEYFLANNLWDEIRVITNKKMNVEKGKKAPELDLPPTNTLSIGDDYIRIILNPHAP